MTARMAEVVAVRLPDVPVIVSVLTPPVADALAVRVRVLLPVVEVGENEAVTPVGRPLMASATFPVKPYCGSTVTVEVIVAPGFTMR